MDAFLDVHKVLSVDPGGRPLHWLGWRTAAQAYAKNDVLWDAGGLAYRIRGGINRMGMQSSIDIQSVIALRGANAERLLKYGRVALSNENLFLRDNFICLYCGEHFGRHRLTRDHVVPRVLGGRNCWENVVCACRACNLKKGGRTPEQAGMNLLAMPYAPNHAEYLILSNRRIIADQMAFLENFVPHDRRLGPEKLEQNPQSYFI